MCKFRRPFVPSLPQSPTKGLPQLGPWHHVGATMEITLDWKWIHKVTQWELNPLHAKPEKIMN